MHSSTLLNPLFLTFTWMDFKMTKYNIFYNKSPFKLLQVFIYNYVKATYMKQDHIL